MKISTVENLVVSKQSHWKASSIEASWGKVLRGIKNFER